MLEPSVEEQARHAVDARFGLRDSELNRELKELAERCQSASSADLDRAGVRLRLICESDLFERARMAWSALSRAQDEHGKRNVGTLERDLTAAIDQYMRQAVLNLAKSLQTHRKAFAPFLDPQRGINADWLGRLRARANEQVLRDVDDYVHSRGKRS